MKMREFSFTFSFAFFFFFFFFLEGNLLMMMTVGLADFYWLLLRVFFLGGEGRGRVALVVGGVSSAQVHGCPRGLVRDGGGRGVLA